MWELVEVDPTRAWLHVRSAAYSVESWVRALREEQPGPAKTTGTGPLCHAHNSQNSQKGRDELAAAGVEDLN